MPFLIKSALLYRLISFILLAARAQVAIIVEGEKNGPVRRHEVAIMVLIRGCRYHSSFSH